MDIWRIVKASNITLLRPPTWTAEYYGDKEYDCGIRINSVDRRDEGTWETQGKVLIKYFISVNGNLTFFVTDSMV